MIQMQTSENDGPAVLKLSGELTIYEASETWRELQIRLKEHPNLALDLAELTQLDTAGVQVLYQLKQQAKAQGQDLPIQRHSAAVLEVFSVLNLASAFGDPLLPSPSTL
jgi:anti-sigma B factor antagonist